MIHHSWHVDHVCCLLSLAESATSVIFVMTKVCPSQQNFCHDKHVCCLLSLAESATSIIFVMTKVCPSQQNFCHDKHVCCDKSFFHDNLLLLWQTYFFSLRQMFCHGKHTFVVTKMILVAAPAKDSLQPHGVVLQYFYFKLFLYHSV